MTRFRSLRTGHLGVGERVDRAFVRLAFREKKGDRARAREPALAARLARFGNFYAEADESGSLFVPPPPIFPESRRRRHRGEGEVLDLSWPSAYAPLHPDYSDTLAKYSANGTCRARWYRHASPAPALVCLHGWGGGYLSLEARIFPVRWLFGLGLDVVLMVLPFHGARSGRKGVMPAFPSPNPPRSNEGFAQAISDIRGLSNYLEARGAPSVGVTGMSLGGFTSALLATVEPKLDYCMPMIPFASLPRLLWSQGAHRKARRVAEEAGVSEAEFCQAFRATTPLERSACIDHRRILVAVGERDRITPPEHGHALHRHFAGSELVSYHGSHLFQFGRGEVFRSMARFLGGLGIIPTR